VPRNEPGDLLHKERRDVALGELRNRLARGQRPLFDQGIFATAQELGTADDMRSATVEVQFHFDEFLGGSIRDEANRINRRMKREVVSLAAKDGGGLLEERPGDTLEERFEGDPRLVDRSPPVRGLLSSVVERVDDALAQIGHVHRQVASPAIVQTTLTPPSSRPRHRRIAGGVIFARYGSP
jgi:hypothetical protein